MAWQVTAEGVVKSMQVASLEEIMLGDYLERLAEEHPGVTAIFDTETEQRYTLAEVLRIGKSIGAMLQRRGVKAHDLVVLSAMTGFKACCYILALVLCQATMVATKHFYSVYEFKEVLKNFPSLKLIIGDNASVSKLRQASSVEVLNLEENWDLSEAAHFKHPGKANPKSSVMLMCLTSGSTGPSKAVCLSHYNVISGNAQWTTEKSHYLMCSPISHLSGNLGFLFNLAAAETMYVASEKLRDDVDKYLDFCSKYKIETALTMPVLLTKLAKYGPTDKLASVKRFLTGGSAIPQTIVDELRTLHPHIFVEVIYGSSELGVVLRSDVPSNIQSLAVLPSVEIKIVDLETKQTLGPHQSGELYCRAPSVALGYHNNEEATKEAFIDGWQASGDVAYRDGEGRIVIVDRVKQMIKCLDSQVAPADLELLLSRDKNVMAVLVGGVPHEEYGETAVAFVVPRSRSNLADLRRKLLADVELNCAFYKHLHGGLFFVEKIPETDSGKFSRREIIASHLNKQLRYLD